MSVNIILYDDLSMERVRNKICNYFWKRDWKDMAEDVLCFKDIYIIFQERMITVNFEDDNWKIQECLDAVLKDEQVAVNYGNKIQYSKAYTKNASLVINFC